MWEKEKREEEESERAEESASELVWVLMWG